MLFRSLNLVGKYLTYAFVALELLFLTTAYYSGVQRGIAIQGAIHASGLGTGP